jgi:hypothetical protein
MGKWGRTDEFIHPKCLIFFPELVEIISRDTEPSEK